MGDLLQLRKRADGGDEGARDAIYDLHLGGDHRACTAAGVMCDETVDRSALASFFASVVGEYHEVELVDGGAIEGRVLAKQGGAGPGAYVVFALGMGSGEFGVRFSEMAEVDGMKVVSA